MGETVSKVKDQFMKLALVWYGRLDAKSARGLYPLFVYKYMNKIIVTVTENVSTGVWWTVIRYSSYIALAFPSCQYYWPIAKYIIIVKIYNVTL